MPHITFSGRQLPFRGSLLGKSTPLCQLSLYIYKWANLLPASHGGCNVANFRNIVIGICPLPRADSGMCFFFTSTCLTALGVKRWQMLMLLLSECECACKACQCALERGKFLSSVRVHTHTNTVTLAHTPSHTHLCTATHTHIHTQGRTRTPVPVASLDYWRSILQSLVQILKSIFFWLSSLYSCSYFLGLFSLLPCVICYLKKIDHLKSNLLHFQCNWLHLPIFCLVSQQT